MDARRIRTDGCRSKVPVGDRWISSQRANARALREDRSAAPQKRAGRSARSQLSMTLVPDNCIGKQQATARGRRASADTRISTAVEGATISSWFGDRLCFRGSSLVVATQSVMPPYIPEDAPQKLVSHARRLGLFPLGSGQQSRSRPEAWARVRAKPVRSLPYLDLDQLTVRGQRASRERPFGERQRQDVPGRCPVVPAVSAFCFSRSCTGSLSAPWCDCGS